MPSQTERIEALARHLLDGFLALRERYELLDPMLFNESLVKVRGSGKTARGFYTLRQSLFMSCVQDIAKLTLDHDKRTPSLSNVAQALGDAVLRDILKEQFAAWRIPSVEEETDPMIVEAIERIEQREEAERRAQFDRLHAEFSSAWLIMSAEPRLKSFRTIRDKVTAHSEIKYVADKYQLIDIATLGIKWGDLRSTISSMQHLVELVGLVVRNSSFAWDGLDQQLRRTAKQFWGVPDAAS